jgi:hypothetical protein
MPTSLPPEELSSDDSNNLPRKRPIPRPIPRPVPRPVQPAAPPPPASTPAASASIIPPPPPSTNHDQAGSIIVTSPRSSLERQMDVDPPLIEAPSTEAVPSQLQNPHGWMLLDKMIVDSDMNLIKLSDRFLELTGEPFDTELWKVHIAKATLDPGEGDDSAIVAERRQWLKDHHDMYAALSANLQGAVQFDLILSNFN